MNESGVSEHSNRTTLYTVQNNSTELSVITEIPVCGVVLRRAVDNSSNEYSGSIWANKNN